MNIELALQWEQTVPFFFSFSWVSAHLVVCLKSGHLVGERVLACLFSRRAARGYSCGMRRPFVQGTARHFGCQWFLFLRKKFKEICPVVICNRCQGFPPRAACQPADFHCMSHKPTKKQTELLCFTVTHGNREDTTDVLTKATFKQLIQGKMWYLNFTLWIVLTSLHQGFKATNWF